ncbi:hypothetical protein OAT35_01715 [Candidatus Pelagibacter sp.]|jgi:hypothetical protein|nr:hypothetical protein [Candidatus Pelagibacter sp.]
MISRIFVTFVFLIISKISYAETKYSNLLDLNSSNNPSDTIQLIDQLTMGFNLEGGFVRDCVVVLEISKKKSNDECNKVLDRVESINRLLKILSSEEFRTNLTILANKIDKKEINIISSQKFEDKLEILSREHEELNDLMSKVNFYLNNL